MIVDKGILWANVPHTIVITTSCGDRMEFRSSRLDEAVFRRTCCVRNNAIVIIANDGVPNNKLMMKFGKERLYVKVKDDLFGEIINESYTYE